MKKRKQNINKYDWITQLKEKKKDNMIKKMKEGEKCWMEEKIGLH